MFDVFMVGRVDAWHTILQQAVYLGIVTAALLQMLAEPPDTPRSPRYTAARSAVLHFLLGTLLNIYVIFYFKSSSFLASFGFLAVVAALLLANEWRRVAGLRLKFALLALCWLSFAALTVPIATGSIGPGVFLVSTLVGCVPLVLASVWVKRRREVLLPLGLVLLGFLASYLARITPPVPLSIPFMGVYHAVERVGQDFRLSHERPAWRIWHRGDQWFRAQPLEQQKAQLRDPAIRARLVEEARNGDYGRAIGAEARKPDWRRMRVLLDMVMPNPRVGDLADERGLDPVELMITMALERDFNLFFIENTGASGVEPETLLQIMKHPRCVMTFSDAGAHVSQICDSSLQVQFLSYWTRERGAFTLEDAVRQVTLAPARVWGFRDRGLLREGMAADLNVIDYARLAPEYPTVSRDLPGGSRRLTQKSRGIRATVVAGQVLFRDGEHTGVLPGQLLRGGGARG